MNNAAKQAIGKLKLEHRNLGLMIGELDSAVDSYEGEQLVNAIDEISHRFSFPVA